jgi:hypothetical protein
MVPPGIPECARGNGLNPADVETAADPTLRRFLDQRAPGCC